MQAAGTQRQALAERICISAWVHVPLDDEQGRGRENVLSLCEEIKPDQALSTLANWMAEPRLAEFFAGVFAGSPYLKALIRRDLSRLQRILAADPVQHFAHLTQLLYSDMAAASGMATAMRLVRVYKTEVALLGGLADLGHVWPVMMVTETLTKCADAATRTSVDFLLSHGCRPRGHRG